MDIFALIESKAHNGAFGMNAKALPTLAQIKAGNYAKGKFTLHGLPIVVEQPRNSIRTGVSKDGKQWQSRMAAHYGYIQGSKGADGDQIDVFIGATPENTMAYVINQNNEQGGFDEHKVMIGFNDADDAKRAYLESYERNWTGFGNMLPVTIEQLKWWLKNGNTKVAITPNSLPYDGNNDMNTFDSIPVAKHLYDLRVSDTENLLLDSATPEYILDDADGLVALDAMVIPYATMEKKVAQLQRIMEGAAGEVKPIASQVTQPFKKNGTVNVAAIFEMDDGQTVSILFHNPDTTPNKLTPQDEMVSWKWMLNKKDVTIVVAPEKGKDLNPREVATRIMKLVQANSARFGKANAAKQARMANIEAMQKQVEAKTAELAQLEDEIEKRKAGGGSAVSGALPKPTKTRDGSENNPLEIDSDDQYQALGVATITDIGSENVYVEKDGLHYYAKVGNTQKYFDAGLDRGDVADFSNAKFINGWSLPVKVEQPQGGEQALTDDKFGWEVKNLLKSNGWSYRNLGLEMGVMYRMDDKYAVSFNDRTATNEVSYISVMEREEGKGRALETIGRTIEFGRFDKAKKTPEQVVQAIEAVIAENALKEEQPNNSERVSAGTAYLLDQGFDKKQQNGATYYTKDMGFGIGYALVTTPDEISGKGIWEARYQTWEHELVKKSSDFDSDKNAPIEQVLQKLLDRIGVSLGGQPEPTPEPKEDATPAVDDKVQATLNSAEFKNTFADILRSIGVIAGIDNGTERGYDRALFVNSIVGKIKTRAKNNQLLGQLLLAKLFVAQKAIPKPAVTMRNSVWNVAQDWEQYTSLFEKPQTESTPEPQPEQNPIDAIIAKIDEGQPYINTSEGYRIQASNGGYRVSDASNSNIPEFSPYIVSRDDLVRLLSGDVKAVDIDPIMAGSESQDIAKVDAAYQFNASDDFKAWVAKSVELDDYSPFLSAKTIDEAVKAKGGTVEWGFYGKPVMDSVTALLNKHRNRFIFDNADTEGNEYVGKIMLGGKVIGRVDMGDDGKAMIFVGSEGGTRVTFGDGSMGKYSNWDSTLKDYVSVLFAGNESEYKVKQLDATLTDIDNFHPELVQDMSKTYLHKSVKQKGWIVAVDDSNNALIVYKDKANKAFSVNGLPNKEAVSNLFNILVYGEVAGLDYPTKDVSEKVLAKVAEFDDEGEKTEKNQEFQYMMLSRLKSDNEYFLGFGGGSEKVLWAGSVAGQIAEMKKLYSQLAVKPEWLTMADIEAYEQKMNAVLAEKNGVKPIEQPAPVESQQAISQSFDMSTWESAKQARDTVEAMTKEFGDKLAQFPTDAMGLTPDDVKQSPEFKEARQGYDRAFSKLREINAYINKHYAKESKDEVKARREARAELAKQSQSIIQEDTALTEAKAFLQSAIDGNVDFMDTEFADKLSSYEQYTELSDMFAQAAQAYADWAVKEAQPALANM